MKKKILVRGPVLSVSGYGEHARFLLRSLRTREDKYDIYIMATGWGETGWAHVDNEERRWIDQKINDTGNYMSSGGQVDMSIQVSIPNEWESVAPINVGVTAGIETTKVAPIWLEKANAMDKVITISEHSKQSFEKTEYQGHNQQTGEQVHLSLQTPIEIIHYPVKTFEDVDLDIDVDYDFNYLTVAQWGPRKNLDNTIRWFLEENFDQEVGLIVKTSIKNHSIVDRTYTEERISNLLHDFPDRVCKVYLLHGDLSEQEMHSLYKHPKVKSLISLSHGEGFGLPIFEAAYSGLPIIAPDWSGHCDFLYTPFESKSKKKNKKTTRPGFAQVEYTLGPIPEHAVWEGVLQADSMWCYPQEGSYKMRLRQVRKNYSKWEKKAKELQKWVLENFESEKQHEKFAASCVEDIERGGEAWLSEIESIVQEYE
jgi:glycosyltransferase involved in cell wall biosynthesis